jgi:hypothetical protein
MNNFVSRVIQESLVKINKEKERLIKSRILERVGEDVDIKKEGVKRFPRITIQYHSHNHSEHYYWNDGSDEGLVLISFYQNNDINLNEGSGSLGFTYK